MQHVPSKRVPAKPVPAKHVLVKHEAATRVPAISVLEKLVHAKLLRHSPRTVRYNITQEYVTAHAAAVALLYA